MTPPTPPPPRAHAAPLCSLPSVPPSLDQGLGPGRQAGRDMGAGGAEEGARGPRAPLEPHWALNTAERFAAVSGGCSSEWKAAPQEDAAASGNRPAGARGSGAASSGFEHMLLPRYSTERRGRPGGRCGARASEELGAPGPQDLPSFSVDQGTRTPIGRPRHPAWSAEGEAGLWGGGPGPGTERGPRCGKGPPREVCVPVTGSEGPGGDENPSPGLAGGAKETVPGLAPFFSGVIMREARSGAAFLLFPWK